MTAIIAIARSSSVRRSLPLPLAFNQPSVRTYTMHEEKVNSAVQQIEDRGFAIIEGLLSGDRLYRAARDAEELLEAVPNDGTDATDTITHRMCKGLFTKTRRFDDLYVLPIVMKLVERVLSAQASPQRYKVMGRSYQFAFTMLKDVVPGQTPREFHQDDVFYPIPRPHPPLFLNSLLALDDFTEATGATRVVPGSHKWSEPVSQSAEFEVAEMPAGSLLIFDGAMWHTNGANSTQDTHRKALNLAYSCRWLQPLGGPYLGLDTAKLDDLEPELRAIL